MLWPQGTLPHVEEGRRRIRKKNELHFAECSFVAAVERPFSFLRGLAAVVVRLGWSWVSIASAGPSVSSEPPVPLSPDWWCQD